MTPRPYQVEALHATVAAFDAGRRSALVVMPTGTGKTVVFTELCRRWSARTGRRALILAHREELIFQAAEKVEMVTGVRPGIEMGESFADHAAPAADCPVVVSSVQTLSRPGRLARFRHADFGLAVVDEAHHCVEGNPSYKRTLDHFQQEPNFRLLGVTATPDRTDRQALGSVFECVAYQYDIADAVLRDAYLVPALQLAVRLPGLDLSGLRAAGGDFRDSDLAGVVGGDQVLWEIAKATHHAARGRPTLVFVPGRGRGECGPSPMMKMADAFNALAPGSCAFVSGDERETLRALRRELVGRFRAGGLQVLVSCGVFLEGFDAPSAAVIAMARPTKSRLLYAQALGRGTRPLPGVIDGVDSAEDRRRAIAASTKPHVLVLDFVGNSGRHKLVSAADVLGGRYPEAVVEAAAARVRRSHSPANVLGALAKEEARGAEMRRAARGRPGVSYTTREVCPFGGRQERRPATEGQLAALKRAGVPARRGLTFAEASRQLDDVCRRRERGPCTPNQARLLRRFRYDPGVSFGEASAIIDRLRANGWSRCDAGPAARPASRESTGGPDWPGPQAS